MSSKPFLLLGFMDDKRCKIYTKVKRIRTTLRHGVDVLCVVHIFSTPVAVHTHSAVQCGTVHLDNRAMAFGNTEYRRRFSWAPSRYPVGRFVSFFNTSNDDYCTSPMQRLVWYTFLTSFYQSMSLASKNGRLLCGNHDGMCLVSIGCILAKLMWSIRLALGLDKKKKKASFKRVQKL